MQELRAAMRDTDRARYARATTRLRRLADNERQWQTAASRASSLAMLDTVLEGTGFRAVESRYPCIDQNAATRF